MVGTFSQEKKKGEFFPEIYRKLQIHLDRLPIGYPATESGVELRILSRLFTPLQAQIALFLTLLPMTCKKVYSRMQKQKESFKSTIEYSDLRKELDLLADTGAIMRGYNGKVAVYSNAMLAIGMFEFQGDFITKEFGQDMLQYMEEGFRDEFFTNSPLQLRPIPTKGILTPDFPVATYDDVRELIRNVTGHISAVNCVCKLTQDQMGHPCSNTDERQWCLTLSYDPKADPNVGDPFHQERKVLTKEETLTLIDAAEKAGLVLQPSNSQKPIFICCCCGDCCGVLTEAKKLPQPASYFQSNYIVHYHASECRSCGMCIDRCQMNAITKGESTGIELDLDRCIGCGLCVTTCKFHALSLEQKLRQYKPPQNTTRLYLKILEGKMGRFKAYRMLFQLLFGKSPQ